MIPVLIASYYAISYSIGVASLVYAIFLRIGSKEALLGRFIAATAAFTVVVAGSSVLNGFRGALGDSGRALIHALNLSAASLIPYLVVAFASEVFPFPGARKAKAVAISLSSVGIALVILDSFFVPSRYLDLSILLLKDAGVILAAIIALKRGTDKRSAFGRFLHPACMVALFLMPLFIAEDLALTLWRLPFGLRGPVSLPGFYGLWSALFILSRLRSRQDAGIALARIDPAFFHAHGISPREADVFRLLMAGRSYKEIMSALFISMPTVKSHVASLYRKTGTANRIELARKMAGASEAGA